MGSRLAVGAALVLVVAALAFPRAPTERTEPRWQELSRLDAPRAHLQAVALATGEIMVVGGLDPESTGIVRNTTELIDPRTGRATRVEGAHVGRIDPKLSTLPSSGLVVATGGSEWTGAGWVQVATTELFDPWTKHWLDSRPMHHARADHGAAVLRDGRLVVAGGHMGPRMLDTVEIFDPIRERWSTAAPLPKPRQLFAMTAILDGRILVAGGLEWPGVPSKTSLYYDPNANAWTEGPKLLVERVLHTTVALKGGDVLLIGGQRAAAGTAERFDFRRRAFVHAGTLELPRMLAQAALLEDGRVLVVGGLPRPASARFEPTGSAELYDPMANSWRTLPSIAEGSAFGGLVTTEFGAVLIAGAGDDEQALDRVVRFQ